jgi:hypothetical protein
MMRTAAILLAMTSIGVLLAPSSGASRPFGGARHMSFHPGSGVARPIAAAPRPSIHSAARLHGSVAARPRHRGSFGSGLWPWYDGYDGYSPSQIYGAPYSEPPYLPSDGAPPIYPRPSQPVAAPTVQVINIIPYRPGCDTEVERLPWKAGTEKTIRIVRC